MKPIGEMTLKELLRYKDKLEADPHSKVPLRDTDKFVYTFEVRAELEKLNGLIARKQ